MTERPGLEVNQPLGIERITVVPGLEMQMGAGRPSGCAAETNDMTCLNPVTDLHVTFGEMGVKGLKTIVVPDDYKVAEPPVVL